MKKLRFAIIGAGKMGMRWFNVIAKHAHLCETVDPKGGTATLEEVLKNKRIDAVLIATPHGSLAEISRKVLKAGKHVLCEKPGALKSKKIKKNGKLAEKKGLIYMVGYNHRFHDGFIKARRMIEEGKIGDIVFIRARYGFGGRKDYDKEWRLDKSKEGSGELMDQGVHMIDLALSYMNGGVDVKGFTSDTFWKKGNKNIGEDNAFVLLNDNFVTASIHVSLTQWKRMHNFEIYGTKGYLSIEGLGQRYGGDKDGNERLVYCKRRKDFGENIKEKIIKVNPIADDSLKSMLKEFMSAIKEKRQPTPDWQDAYQALRVVEQVYKQNK